MNFKFPEQFIWGTSTAAAQIETAANHQWKGLKAVDGYTFDRTIDHEKRRMEDAEIISTLGNSYRMSLDWSRLQTEANGKFDRQLVEEYRSFMKKLKEKGTSIMLVAHHFMNPNWFDEAGHWWTKNSIDHFSNYVQQLAENFSDLADYWNTFNEPGVYLSNGFFTGIFPPFKKNPLTLRKALINMSKANEKACAIIRDYSDAPIGISKNSVNFYPINKLGKLPAKLVDYIFNDLYTARFVEPLDFLGISYYARMGLDPLPVSYVDTPEKIIEKKLPHDDMWEYYPEGMGIYIRRHWNKYKKPIIITESGVCTDDSDFRIQSTKHYLQILHECIKEGIDIRGYYHWSTFDNFEWNIGPTFRFGLVHVNFEDGSMTRTLKPCGEFYQEVVKQNGF